MRIILHSSSFYILGAAVLIISAIYFLIGAVSNDDQELITAKVERGDVVETVSVSGIVEAKNTADLAFPVSGVVTEVFTSKGNFVKKGDILATLASAQLVAQRLDAVGALKKAEADKDELVLGPRDEERSVTDTSVVNARENLDQVVLEQNEKVENARRILLSTGLEAYSVSSNETADQPTITGTYSCESEGLYNIDVYGSGAMSGFSFLLGGIEDGRYQGFTDSPGKLGKCGLFIQFDENSTYTSSEWEVPIPNIRSSTYQTNLNSYNLALKQRDNAIKAAENALALALDEAKLSNAPPRTQELERADAAILQARARIDAIDAQLADRSIMAPFNGMVTEVSILPGETATAEPVITLLATDKFDLTARIPEIDITKVLENQYAKLIFDARRSETVDASVGFISPLATEIDGVAYFEATIIFNEVPQWMRSGLNADVDIEVAKVEDVTKIPRRFLVTENGAASVLILKNNEIISTPVEVGFSGNDGFVEIIGIDEGTTIVAP